MYFLFRRSLTGLLPHDWPVSLDDGRGYASAAAAGLVKTCEGVTTACNGRSNESIGTLDTTCSPSARPCHHRPRA